MEENRLTAHEHPLFEQQTDDEPQERTLTAEQMTEFRLRVGKEMQLRAQRSQPEAQRSTTRSLQAKRREHGSSVLRHLNRRRGY